MTEMTETDLKLQDKPKKKITLTPAKLEQLENMRQMAFMKRQEIKKQKEDEIKQKKEEEMKKLEEEIIKKLKQQPKEEPEEQPIEQQPKQQQPKKKKIIKEIYYEDEDENEIKPITKSDKSLNDLLVESSLERINKKLNSERYKQIINCVAPQYF